MSERKKAVEIKAPRGTVDILPPDSEIWRRVAKVGYGYREIILPIMESTEVFARGIGQGTDIVQKEMFTFSDKGGRSLTLRPEATAGVARAFVQHKMDAGGLPVKLYYQGPMFRHERPQAGRYRQFRQLGVELIGSPEPSADAEVIILCGEFLRKLGIETELAVNSVGDAKCRPAYIEALVKYLQEKKELLCGDCRRRAVQNPLRVLDCKVEACVEVMAGAPSLEDYLCDPCREHQAEVERLLRAVSLPFRSDSRLVRGLDYYTRTVFEFQDPRLGGQNTLAAGGRYDALVEELGGKPTPATGFSIGMERVMLAGPRLEDKRQSGVFVVAIGEAARTKAFQVAQELRGAGIRADLDHLGRSPKAQMREADRDGCELSVIIGDDEMEGGYYSLRDMRSADQQRVEKGMLVEAVRRHLAGTGA